MNNDSQSIVAGLFIGMALMAIFFPRYRANARDIIDIDLMRVEFLRQPEWYERN